MHLFPSCSVLESPSFPWPASPPRTVVDWFVGLRKATFVPVITRVSPNSRKLTKDKKKEARRRKEKQKEGRERINGSGKSVSKQIGAELNCLEPNKLEERCCQSRSCNKTSVTGRMHLVIKRDDYLASQVVSPSCR